MNNQVKSVPSVEHDAAGPWYPLRKWWEPSRRFNQEAGALPLLDLGGPRRMDWLERGLWSCYWPGYSPASLFVPHISGSSAGPEQYMWRVYLDVSLFSPSEITLSVKDGFLQVGGRHEERPDEHGFVSRCFTRKYRLPAETDATKIVSSLSVDGILSVEVPVPAPSVPATIIIPIKVEEESSEELYEAENSSHPEEPPAAEVHEDSFANGVVQDEEKTEEESSEKTVEQDSSESREAAPEKATEEGIDQPEEKNDACKGCEISQEIL